MGVPFVNTLDVSSDSERFHNFQLQELLSGRAQSWQWYREMSFNPVKRVSRLYSIAIKKHEVVGIRT